MRLLFLGTASFAVPALQECATHHELLAVVAQPAKPGSRGRPAPRPVADAAQSLGVEVVAPRRIRDPQVVDELLQLGADAIVVAAYGQILPPALLDGPRFGALNVHASLLPRWRGASPVAHAILAGDTHTGVCIMRMDAGLDTGPVYRCERIAIRDDATTLVLSEALAQLGAQLLIDVLVDVQRGVASLTPQSEDGVTHAPRLSREQGKLRWDEVTAAEIDRHVRALQPWPGVTMPLAGAEVSIVDGVCEAMPEGRLATPGTVLGVRQEAVLVAARDSVYGVRRVHPPGSREMDAAAFLRGRRAWSR